MKLRTSISSSLLILLLLCSAALQAQESADRVGISARQPLVTTQLFALHNEPAIQLHHFLFRWAEIEAFEAGETKAERFFRPSDRQRLSELDDDERVLWQGLIKFYRQHVIDRSLLFDRRMVAVRDVLTGKISRNALGAYSLGSEEHEVLRHLERSLPLYLRVWWPEHKRLSNDWIAGVVPYLVQHEVAIATRIVHALDSSWPSPPNRVDVSAYSNRTSAYTTSQPHTVLSSANPGLAPPYDLEIFFHEHLHSEALEPSIHARVASSFAKLDAKPPRNLWHILLFATAGEATRLERVAAGAPDYAQYALKNRVFHGSEIDRRSWQAVKDHWLPAMVRGETLEETIDDIAGALTHEESE